MRYDPCHFRPPMLAPSHPDYRTELTACMTYWAQIQSREDELSVSNGGLTYAQDHAIYLTGTLAGHEHHMGVSALQTLNSLK